MVNLCLFQENKTWIYVFTLKKKKCDATLLRNFTKICSLVWIYHKLADRQTGMWLHPKRNLPGRGKKENKSICGAHDSAEARHDK